MASNHAPLQQHPSTAKYREADSQKPYEHQEFPKLVYKGKKHKAVADAAELQAAVDDGFSTAPPVPEKEEE